MEETHLQELRKGRELTAQKEENQYLKNLVEEQERSICRLENQIVQQNMVRELCTGTYELFHTDIYKSPQLLNAKLSLLTLDLVGACFHYF